MLEGWKNLGAALAPVLSGIVTVPVRCKAGAFGWTAGDAEAPGTGSAKVTVPVRCNRLAWPGGGTGPADAVSEVGLGSVSVQARLRATGAPGADTGTPAAPVTVVLARCRGRHWAGSGA